MTHRNGVRIYNGYAEPFIAQKQFVITDQNVHEHIARIGQSIRKYVNDNNRDGVVVGLSGGVDSAVVARLVQMSGVPLLALLMPNGEAGKQLTSFKNALDLVEKFAIPYRIIDIEPACAALMLPDNDPIVLAATEQNRQLARMNIAPRIRKDKLYEVAQLERKLVIGTSNMVERLLGHSTKGGDSIYDFGLLDWMVKREVYVSSRALEILDAINNQPPSADLYEGQTDEAEFGFSYDQVDDFILRGTSGDQKIDELIDQRYLSSQHKREPAPSYRG